MEGLFTSRDVQEYINEEKSRGISFTKELSLYFRATQKDLDEGPDNLKLWINYIKLLSLDCEALEIREIFKMLKLRYWKHLEYWEALVEFERKKRSKAEFEEKVIKNSIVFLQTKDFYDKRTFIEYLRSFINEQDKKANLEVESCKTFAVEDNKIKLSLGNNFCDADFRITQHIKNMSRRNENPNNIKFENETLKDVNVTLLSPERRKEREKVGKEEDGAEKKGKKTNSMSNLVYPTPSEMDRSARSRAQNLELVNIKLETVEVPLLVFKGQNLHLIKELGKGGSSKVYQVLYNDRIFALKRVSLREEQRESFIDEINVLKKLKGKKGIIELIDYDLKSSELDLLLECGDVDLGTVIRGSSLTLNFIKDIWEQILNIVNLVHQQRIIHKDLKPANFLFVKGRLKLIDFGISKEIKNDTTKIFNETQIGTVNYMSPESLDRDVKLGRSTDVWSLGCILYEMVYGNTPFGNYCNVVQKIKKLQEDDMKIEYPDTPFREMLPTIKKCLVKEREKRATVKELIEEEEFLRLRPDDLERLARKALSSFKNPRTLVKEFLEELKKDNK